MDQENLAYYFKSYREPASPEERAMHIVPGGGGRGARMEEGKNRLTGRSGRKNGAIAKAPIRQKIMQNGITQKGIKKGG